VAVQEYSTGLKEGELTSSPFLYTEERKAVMTLDDCMTCLIEGLRIR